MNIDKLSRLIEESSCVETEIAHGDWTYDYSIRLKGIANKPADPFDKLIMTYSNAYNRLKAMKFWFWYTIYFDGVEIKEISNSDAKRLYALLKKKHGQETRDRDSGVLQKLRDVLS